MASREDELAGGLGTIARALFTAGTVEQTLVRIVHTARDTIDACDYAGLSLVTGPSRTADIERVLTIGVQGPKVLHVLVLTSS